MYGLLKNGIYVSEVNKLTLSVTPLKKVYDKHFSEILFQLFIVNITVIDNFISQIIQRLSVNEFD